MKMREEMMQPERIRPYLQKLQKTKVEEGKDETRICHYRQYSDAIAKKSPKFRDAFSKALGRQIENSFLWSLCAMFGSSNASPCTNRIP